MTFKAILMMSVLCCFTNASAFTFTSDFNKGNYWPSFPLRIHIQAEGPELQDMVEEAIQEWHRETGLTLWEVQAPSVTGAYHEVRWAKNFTQETGLSPLNTLAVTVRYSQYGLFQRTEIILNPLLLDIDDQDDLVRTIMHELGHTLGLDHSSYQEAIMAAYLSNQDHLHSDDIAGAESIYTSHLERQQNPSGISAVQGGSVQSQSSGKNGCSFNAHADTFRGPPKLNHLLDNTLTALILAVLYLGVIILGTSLVSKMATFFYESRKKSPHSKEF
jgi:hypothetical protein